MKVRTAIDAEKSNTIITFLLSKESAKQPPIGKNITSEIKLYMTNLPILSPEFGARFSTQSRVAMATMASPACIAK
jgi:hypothetical protein